MRRDEAPLTDRVAARMKIAAALRAAGKTWEDVGQALGCSKQSACQMMLRHPTGWAAAYNEAVDQLYSDIVAEQLDFLRNIERQGETTETGRIRSATAILNFIARWRQGSQAAQQEPDAEDEPREFDEERALLAATAFVFGRLPIDELRWNLKQEEQARTADQSLEPAN